MKKKQYMGALVCVAALSCASVLPAAEQQVKASVESQNKLAAKSSATAQSTTVGLTKKAVEAQLAANGVSYKKLSPKQRQDVYVDVIIQLSAAPAAENGSVSTRSSSAEIEKASKKVIADQEAIKNKVKSITKQDIEASYGYVVNGFATKAKVKDIQKLRAIRGVKSVTLAKVYYANDSSADDMANVSTVWNNYKYKGEGTVVSVIDTGIDPNHKDLRLSNNTKVKLSEKAVDNFTKTAGYGRYFTSKVPYGHNYADNNENVADDNPDEQHGMHVAGIVGANGTSHNAAKSVVGVAPEAQLLAMKAFSNSDSASTTDSTSVIGAIDDSAKLGADVLNMSLGSTSGEQTDDDPEVAAVDRATSKGTAAVISAGNAGTTNSQTDGNNKAYYGNPDMETLGSPGTARSATTVASAENTKITTDGITISGADGKQILGPETTQLSGGTDRSFFNGKQFYVVKDKKGKLGIGSANQYTNDVKGKIAIVKRGEIAFTEKQANAKAAGAAGLIVVNNQAGNIPLTNAQYNDGFSTAGLSNDAGNKLVSYLKAHPNEALQVSIIIQPLSNAARENDLMSDFTSYGPVSNLAFKPDIAAPGGNIWSTQNNNGYVNMSGTSMASPFIAGTQALLSQAMNDKSGAFYKTYQKMSPSERTAFMKNIEMNTASIEPDIGHDNVIVSPRRQGAGFINAKAVIDAIAKNPSTVSGSNGYPGVELKDFKERSRQFTLKFTNRTNKSLTYKLTNAGKNSDVYTSATDSSNTLYDKKIDGASVKADGSIEVPANSSKNVTFTLNLPGNFAENQYVEGFLTFTASDNSQLKIPYMGFFGDWADAEALPIFAGLNNPDVFDPANGNNGTIVEVGNNKDSYYAGLNKDADGNYRVDPKQIAISNAAKAQYKWIKPTYYLFRNANNVKVQILNKNGKVINTLASLSSVTKTYYYSSAQKYIYFSDAPAWDGTYFNQKTGKTEKVPDGTYTYRVVGTVDGTHKQQHYDIKVNVDSVKPEIRNLKLASRKDAKTGKVSYFLTAEAKDNLSGLDGTANVSVNDIVNNGAEYETKDKTEDGFTKIEIPLNEAQAKSLAAGKNTYSVAIFDNASNSGTTSGDSQKPGEVNYGLVIANNSLPDKITTKSENYDAKSKTYEISGSYPAQFYATYTDKDGKEHEVPVKSSDGKFTIDLPISSADYKTTVKFYTDQDHKTLIKQKEINVSVVPAKVNSLSVDGHETYNANTDKAAKEGQTSEDSVKLTGKASADTEKVQIKSGKKTINAKLDSNHNFSAELPVSFGENSFTVIATDADGNSSSIRQKVKSSDRGKTVVSSKDVIFNNLSWGTHHVNKDTKNYNAKTGELTVSGRVKRPTTTLRINGKDIKINSNGTFKFTLKVGSHGSKVFSALIGDSTVGQTVQERLTFYVDSNAPKLVLNGDNTVYTNKDKYTISGTVSDDYKFYDLAINDNDLDSSWADVDYNSNDKFEKKFSHEVSLKSGKNIFNIKVTDVNDNTAEQTVVVYYEAKKELVVPEITSKTNDKGSSVTLNATTSEKDAKVVYSTDGGKHFVDLPNDGVTVKENGKVQFKAVDKYGNESKTVTYNVTNIKSASDDKPSKPAEDSALVAAKKALKAKVEATEKLDLSKYTDESRKNLAEALQAAKSVLANKDAKLGDVEKADKSLEAAKSALITKAEADAKATQQAEIAKAKKELQEKVDKASKLDLSKYTDESAKLFAKALQAAKAILENKDAKLADVEKGEKALETAKSALSEKKSEPDQNKAQQEAIAKAKKALQEKVDEASKLDLSKYTDKSKDVLAKSLDFAKSVLENKDAKLADVEATGKLVEAAVAGLEEKPVEKPTMPSQSSVVNGFGGQSDASKSDQDSKPASSSSEQTSPVKSTTSDAVETGKETKIMFKSVLYNKDLGKIGKVVKGYSKLNLVTENDKLKVFTFKGQHFYKVVNKDQYVRVRNVTGTKVTLKRSSFVYKSNGKRATLKLLRKGTKVTVYGDQYKAIKHYRKAAYRIGQNRYVKAVNVNKFKLVK